MIEINLNISDSTTFSFMHFTNRIPCDSTFLSEVHGIVDPFSNVPATIPEISIPT